MILAVNHVDKSFHLPGSGRVKVLNQVSFSLETGHTLAITGHSGSGKTTLLSLIAGLDSPDTGSIFLDGKDICTMNQAELTRYRAGKIAMIFQSFHLMPHLTAQENISLPLEILQQDRIKARTHTVLEQVGLTHRAGHLPGQLSGGECQRVAIARALIVQPALILADEPTGNLDAKTGKMVADLLFDLVDKENKTLVVVTHNQDLAGRCRHVKTLSRGNLV
jgi:putative ABC transport system ATP-binding protein